jgi:hypothetical protein
MRAGSCFAVTGDTTPGPSVDLPDPVGAGLDRAEADLVVLERREHENLRPTGSGLQGADGVDAADPAHPHVEQDDVARSTSMTTTCSSTR